MSSFVYILVFVICSGAHHGCITTKSSQTFASRQQCLEAAGRVVGVQAATCKPHRVFVRCRLEESHDGALRGRDARASRHAEAADRDRGARFLGADVDHSWISLPPMVRSPERSVLGSQVIFAVFPAFRAGGGRRRSEKDAVLRTAAHSSTEGVQLTR
jgi:hypothetical protein